MDAAKVQGKAIIDVYPHIVIPPEFEDLIAAVNKEQRDLSGEEMVVKGRSVRRRHLIVPLIIDGKESIVVVS